MPMTFDQFLIIVIIGVFLWLISKFGNIFSNIKTGVSDAKQIIERINSIRNKRNANQPNK